MKGSIAGVMLVGPFVLVVQIPIHPKSVGLGEKGNRVSPVRDRATGERGRLHRDVLHSPGKFQVLAQRNGTPSEVESIPREIIPLARGPATGCEFSKPAGEVYARMEIAGLQVRKM